MGEEQSLLKAALDMYQAQYTATDRLWGYFSAVSLALVAYTISSEKVKRIFPEAVVVIGAYLIFCIGNFSALSTNQTQLIALGKLVQDRGARAGIDMSSFAPFAVDQLQHYYVAVVIAIALATLLLAWYRGRGTSQKPSE